MVPHGHRQRDRPAILRTAGVVDATWPGWRRRSRWGHLSDLLTTKDYEIFVVIRGQNNPRKVEFQREFPNVILIEADLTDLTSLIRVVELSAPDEIYNLAAISHVGYSFGNPSLTAETTGKGVLNILEAIRLTGRADSAKSNDQNLWLRQEVAQYEWTRGLEG